MVTSNYSREVFALKIMISASEAMEKGVWSEILRLFGRDKDEEIWPQEVFILTEEQALKLNLIKK
ncbi:MAG: hypothetical protein K0Q73_4126 [Paenibacillus sp.]|jgi:hypothetical protein|nr:hypothetical protein [Paenibacillus sp.]